MKFGIVILVAVASFLSQVPAGAQGITEYGSLLGGQARPSNGLQGALNRSYASPSSALQNINQLSSPAGIRPAVTDSSELSQYGKQANKSYLNARQLAKDGHCCEAIREYSNALLIRERIWGDRDPAVAELLKQQADLYMKKGHLNECEKNYRKILAINVKRYGAGAKETVPLITTLADLCEREGNNPDALTYYQQLVAIQTRYDQPGSAALKLARLKLATQLTVSFDYPAAERILIDAIGTEEASPTPDKPYLVKALDVYGGLLRETFRPEEAAKIEKRQHELQFVPAETADKAPPAAKTSSDVVVSAQPISATNNSTHR